MPEPAAAGGADDADGGSGMTVRATVNGEPVTLAPGTSVADLVAQTCPSERGVAVALDREVVPRSSWPATLVTDRAAVEIVTAAAGG